MNWAGATIAAVRMAPADQRLGADRPFGDQVEGGLIEQEQLAAIERLAKVHLDREAVVRLGLHTHLEEGVAVSARSLGLVQGDIPRRAAGPRRYRGSRSRCRCSR